MIYKTTSVKEVIGRILRNTGKSMSSEYIDDMLEWIPEGIRKLETKYTLYNTSTTLEMVGHVASLPCDLINIIAVEYNGSRLREGGDIRDLTSKSPLSLDRESTSTVLETDTVNYNNYAPDTIPDNDYITEHRGLNLVASSSSANSEYYKLQMNCIQTSFEEGNIVLHYRKLPTCKDGYPLVPDNENYKTALYWYVLSMLLGAGYEHKVFNYNMAFQNWEMFARRAINQITYPSVDRMERIYRAGTRLVPPEHFYEDFRINSEQIQPIVK
jgi:hypothetical protein